MFSKKHLGGYYGWDYTQLILMFLPMFIVYLIFTVYPVVQGIFYSFTDWDGFNSTFHWIGLANYKTLFTDYAVVIPMRNTFIYAFLVTVIQNAIALLAAVAIDRELHTKNLLRTLLFIPVVLSPLIVGYIWSYLFTDPIESVGRLFHIKTLANNILGSSAAALYTGVFVSVWKSLGYTMIIYIAALQGISKDVYEASHIDGAAGFRKFRYITFPLIAPAFTINMVLVMEGAFKQFDLIFALTGGGPGNSSQLISLTIYTESFEFYRAGYGTTMGVILFLVIIVLSIIELMGFRRREENIV